MWIPHSWERLWLDYLPLPSKYGFHSIYFKLFIVSSIIIKFLRDRYCESPDETFYQGQCLPIGSNSHCPPYSLMELYDGPDNQGFCDCLELPFEFEEFMPRPIYSDKTGMCHKQYTQVSTCIKFNCFTAIDLFISSYFIFAIRVLAQMVSGLY